VFGETNEFQQDRSSATVLEAQAQAFSEISRSLTQAVEQAREQAAEIVRRAHEHAASVVNSANEHAAEAHRQAIAAEQRAAAAYQRLEAAETRLAGTQARVDQAQAKLSAIGQQASEIARLVAQADEPQPAVGAETAPLVVVAEMDAPAEQLAAPVWGAEPAGVVSAPEHNGFSWNSADDGSNSHSEHSGSSWNADQHSDPASNSNGSWAESHATPSSDDLDPFGVLASLRHAVDNASS
jgi:hypothetical protein